MPTNVLVPEEELQRGRRFAVRTAGLAAGLVVGIGLLSRTDLTSLPTALGTLGSAALGVVVAEVIRRS